jgi:hypothetical protein
MKSFLARDLHSQFTAMRVFTGKKIFIFSICLSLVFIFFFFCSFSTLQDDYVSATPLIGQVKEITLTEPVIMLFFGAGLITLAGFAKRRFRGKTSR